MPQFTFDPKQSIIICHAEIIGPKIDLSLKLALDTGATYTMIPIEAAVAIGCDPLRSRRKIEITTGSSIEYVPVVTVPKFRALGIELKNIEVICHNLPTQSPVEGLLGLNFLKSAKAIIDFSKNTIIVLTRKDFEELFEDAEMARARKVPEKLKNIRKRMEKGYFVTLEELKRRLG